jgi:hypothetical protein
MNKYYVQWVYGTLGGDWCVFRKRKYIWDKKVAEFSVFVKGDVKAQSMAIDSKRFYEEQENE